MKAVYILVVVAVALALRLIVRQRQRRRKAAALAEHDDVAAAPPSLSPARRTWLTGASLGDVGLVARREILERVRGRIFRVGTHHHPSRRRRRHRHPEDPHQQHHALAAGRRRRLSQRRTRSGRSSTAASRARHPSTSSRSRARSRPRRRSGPGKLDVAIVNGDKILVYQPITSDTTVGHGQRWFQVLAPELGVLHAYQQAGLSAPQIETGRAGPGRCRSRACSRARGSGVSKGTSVIGVVLIFLMLTQYNTWILMGVMQEKASRVVEVLLAAVRPIQLLGGKVLGIGLVAMGQAALIVAFAFVVSKAVGSDLLKGTGRAAPPGRSPLAGSRLRVLLLAVRRRRLDRRAPGPGPDARAPAQPAHPDRLHLLHHRGELGQPEHCSSRSLAYFPPTAPFAMPVLVGLNQVAWWQFLISVALSIAGTAFDGLVRRRASTGGPCSAQVSESACVNCGAAPGHDLARRHRLADPA